MTMFVLVVDTSLMNTDVRPRALQVALLVPILAGLLGLLNGFRMIHQPDPWPRSCPRWLSLSRSPTLGGTRWRDQVSQRAVSW